MGRGNHGAEMLFLLVGRGLKSHDFSYLLSALQLVVFTTSAGFLNEA